MLLNGHNLELVKFASRDKNQHFNTDILQIGPNGTLATDGYILIHVSGLDDETVKPFLLEASTTPKFTDEPFDSTALALFNRAEGRTVDFDYQTPKGIPEASFSVRASFLLRAALSALLFAGKQEAVINVEVYDKPSKPLKMTTENKATGQKWTGLVMQSAGKGTLTNFLKVDHLESNVALAAESDEFEAAVRAAELLGI